MRKIVVFLLLPLFVLLDGCASPPGTEDFQNKATALSLPVGVWYRSDADEWEADFLPEALCEVFFEEKPSFPWVLYLGTDDEMLCEILYASLPSEYEAILLASRLSARIESLKKWSDGTFDESLADAAVLRRGAFVLYAVTPLNARLFALAEGE